MVTGHDKELLWRTVCGNHPFQFTVRVGTCRCIDDGDTVLLLSPLGIVVRSEGVEDDRCPFRDRGMQSSGELLQKTISADLQIPGTITSASQTDSVHQIVAVDEDEWM
jgi:hypothetical protein